MSERGKPRILFAGTPEIAAYVLEKLVNEGAEICGVITAPDKPAGRGLQMHSSAVKQTAIRFGLKIFQPEKLRNPEFLEELTNCHPDLGIVVAFRMLPEEVWGLPPLGTINLHASLLPAYRGAAPINRAIMAGEKVSGISTFLLKKEIDTGDILLQEKMNISEDETAGELYQRMMLQGAELVWRTAIGLFEGSLKGHPQDENLACAAPKIYREDGRINPQNPAAFIHNQIRGLQPQPGAFTESEGRMLKIHQSRKTGLACATEEAGKLLIKNKKLLLACSDEYLEIIKIQPEGKRIMTAAEFMAGHKIN
jgi:methionyl-tRNA formyltransferase